MPVIAFKDVKPTFVFKVTYYYQLQTNKKLPEHSVQYQNIFILILHREFKKKNFFFQIPTLFIKSV